MTINEHRTRTAWSRLQALSCLHANADGPNYSGTGRHRTHTPSETIRENCEILGKGTEEQIKARVLWYITFHPTIFNACSEAGWRQL